MLKSLRLSPVIVVLFIVMFGISLWSQTSNVTATITDSDSQTWNNGSFIVTFQPTPGINGPYTWNGGQAFTKQVSGTLNGSGVMTVSLSDNGFIAPGGSQWIFTICPNASAPCSNVTLPVTGASPNLSALLSAGVKAPRFQTGTGSYGYLDVEAGTPAAPITPGTIYWNVSNAVTRQWTGVAWQNLSAGGGTVIINNGAATPGFGLPLRILMQECDSQGMATPGTGLSAVLVGTQTYAAPTSTETQGCNELSAAAGSTNVVVAVARDGSTGSNGGFLMFATTPRWSERVSFVTLTNARYWTGMTDGNSPTDWSNTTFATDAPARFFCMFRYSSTTDTTIKAVCSNATTQTVTDTGVTPVAGTSILFEIQPNPAMTSVAFFINGTSVATITTNLPNATNRFATVWLADNKNTATQVGGVFFWSETFYSK